MTETWIIFAKAVCCGCAATGFAILFNTEKKVLPFIWMGGFLVGLVKFIFLSSLLGAGITLASFAGAITIGLIGIPIALKLNVPTVVVNIASVIPLVPGAFAYRTMLGLMKLTRAIDEDYSRILSETVRNGVLTLFVIIAIAIGIVVPMIIFEKRITKNYLARN